MKNNIEKIILRQNILGHRVNILESKLEFIEKYDRSLSITLNKYRVDLSILWDDNLGILAKYQQIFLLKFRIFSTRILIRACRENREILERKRRKILQELEIIAMGYYRIK